MRLEELNDPFDNVEQLFRNAYALSDPVPELLNLLKAHPSSNPGFCDWSCDALHRGRGRGSFSRKCIGFCISYSPWSPDAPMLNDGSSSLVEVFSFELADLHSRGLLIDMYRSHINFGPSNLYLINSLVSGLSFKYRLTSCSDQYGSIMKGLNAYPDGSSTSELLVIGACIKLLINGSYIISTAKSYIKSVNEVATNWDFKNPLAR